MALTVPDIQNITNGTNGFDFQTIWDQQDFNALSNGQVCGVYYGCNVVPNATPNYGASVDPGYITIVGNSPITVAGGSVAVAAASSTDRRDIIIANLAGGIGIVQGTACGTAGWVRTTSALPPVKPSFGGSVMLGEIAVPGGAASVSSIAASCIVDKRCMLIPYPLAEVSHTASVNYVVASTTFVAVDSTNLTMSFVAPPSGRVRLRCSAVIGQSASADYAALSWLNHGASTIFTGVSNVIFKPGETTDELPLSAEWLVTNLTYGTSYGVDLATGSNAGSVTFYATSITSTTVGTTQAGPIHLIAEAA